MSLDLGSSLGSFTIIEPLGAGAMGEVYRARDKKLQREVAIKLLPELFAKDKQRVSRFVREARLLAQLDHQNVGGIHDIQRKDQQIYLVMQLIEGQTLDERLAAGTLDACGIVLLFLQIAEGLSAAHRAGIIHRDLKPANIKITPKGVVKILDFGLAKAFDSSTGGDSSAEVTAVGSTSELTNFPTLADDSASLTAHGALLGTPAYMSPEQVRGERADNRTDIWSFGCILFEALSRRRAFKGFVAGVVFSRILDHEPEWGALPEALPKSLKDLLRKCLDKDPAARPQTIDEARDQLAGCVDKFGTASSKTAGAGTRWRGYAMGAAGIAVAALAVAGGVSVWRGDSGSTADSSVPPIAAPTPEADARPLFTDEAGAATEEAIRIGSSPDAAASTEVLLPEGELAMPHFTTGVSFAISPDGARIAYTASRFDRTAERGADARLFVHEIAASATRELGRTEGASQPFFSSDGRTVGFFAYGKLMKTAADGSQARPTEVCPAPHPAGGAWDGSARANGYDSIVFAAGAFPVLYRVRAAGGTAQRLSILDSGAKELGHIQPVVLPNGAILFGVQKGSRDKCDIWTLDEARKRPADELLTQVFRVNYVSSGHLVYARSGRFESVGFDAESLSRIGEPEIVESAPIRMDYFGRAGQFAIAGNGTMIALHGSGSRALKGYSESGQTMRIPVEPAAFLSPAIAPDGMSIAVTVDQGGGRQIRLYRFPIDPDSSFTDSRFSGASSASAAWSPDGNFLAYPSNTQQFSGPGIYLKNEPLDQPPPAVHIDPGISIAFSKSPRLRFAVVRLDGDTGADISLGEMPLPPHMQRRGRAGGQGGSDGFDRRGTGGGPGDVLRDGPQGIGPPGRRRGPRTRGPGGRDRGPALGPGRRAPAGQSGSQGALAEVSRPFASNSDRPMSPESRPFLNTPADEIHARFSPNRSSGWLAYASNEPIAGGPARFEVYVIDFENNETPIRVSQEGGWAPAWSADGRKIYFRKGRQVFVAEPTGDPNEPVGRPRFLFDGPFLPPSLASSNYDIDPQTGALLMIEQDTAQLGRLVLTPDWASRLAKQTAQ